MTEPARRAPDWYADFAAEPAARLDALLRRHETVPGLDRYDPHDAIAILFQGRTGDDPLVLALDQALADWIAARLTQSPAAAKRVGALAADMTEAVSLAPRLPLPLSRRLLCDRFAELDTWTWMVSGDGRDVRRHYWLALAGSQVNNRFVGHWLRVCDAVGRGEFPQSYLSIALQGLRGLPRRSLDLPDEVLAGLARWARHLSATPE
ncbi:MAG TPA: hypothetical protein VLL76_12355, partial [Candidatus Omnitrophota bacterium]|nr:hypothetical protein [Candidatus Omnitrophota bacterium]